MYAITTQLRFFHNNSPGTERFLGTPRFWGIFDLGTDGNLCRQGSDLFLDFCEKQPYSINIITITVIERYERKKTMSTLKYSRQRESIKVCLQGRKDHPTADMLYTDVRKEFPNISLGTVYRNLNLLVETGEYSGLPAAMARTTSMEIPDPITTLCAGNASRSTTCPWRQWRP